MGLPVSEDLTEILKESLSPMEAEVALAIPNGVIPMQPVPVDEISSGVNLQREDLLEILESLSQRGLLVSGQTKDGEKGYALMQIGFGLPQNFFWKREDTPQARKMAGLVGKYFSPRVMDEAYNSEPKPYRYIPVGRSIKADMQAVYTNHMMENVIENSNLFAVTHCACRVACSLAGEGCQHPTEVCVKFDDLARYVIDRGFGREITKDEALEIIRQSEEAGLVHFVDNAEGDIKHNCNCCGCACWNVGPIKRRDMPRDALMATYFLRETDEDECIGCGKCIDVCPVDALQSVDDSPIVDQDWCIGCGVCHTVCPSGAVKLSIRPDKTGQMPWGKESRPSRS
jgi:Fe-S-cluster-containing hydrogenase component 2